MEDDLSGIDGVVFSLVGGDFECLGDGFDSVELMADGFSQSDPF